MKCRISLLILLIVFVALAGWITLGNALSSTSAAEFPTETPEPPPEPTIPVPQPSATPASRAFVPITFEMARIVTATAEPPPIP